MAMYHAVSQPHNLLVLLLSLVRDETDNAWAEGGEAVGGPKHKHRHVVVCHLYVCTCVWDCIV